MQLCFRCKQQDISSVGEDQVMFQVGAQSNAVCPYKKPVAILSFD
jgi:hypothetical protein